MLAKKSLIFAAMMTAVVLPATSAQQPSVGMTERDVDQLVTDAMSAFNVPGVAVGIVKDNRVVLSKGYGVTQMLTGQEVDGDTIFKIASTTKAFTTAAIAILVDQGKLRWDSKVVSILPNFALNDPWVTANFTVADLVTHRSGLAKFAGDLMLWPEPAGFSRREIINNLKHLKSASGFRSEYAYDNLLYIVAGELIAAVAKKSWETFIHDNIFSPLQMTRCFAGPVPSNQMVNIAQPHGVIDGKLEIIKRNQTYDKPSVMAAAGGIKCSVNDLVKWVQVQLNQGRYQPKGTKYHASVFSAGQSKLMWQPHTILPVSKRDKKRHNTNFKAYGLGWRLADVHGFKSVSHTGTLSGNLAYITLIPELELGVVVVLNQNSYYARSAIMNGVVESFMPISQRDWVTQGVKDQALRNAKQTQNDKGQQRSVVAVVASIDTSRYVGLYQDAWFGHAKISLEGESLYFRSLKSLRMHGKMIPLANNQFLVEYSDRTLEADAIITFEINDMNKVLGFSMQRANDKVDLSFDYPDLAFKVVE